MQLKISADGMDKAVKKAMDDFGKVSYEGLKSAAQKTAKDVIKDTKTAAPTRSGEYRKGWSSTVTSDNSREYGAVVHNKKKPGLAHLLEHGHGGQHPASAKPHITTDEKVKEIFEGYLEKELKG